MFLEKRTSRWKRKIKEVKEEVAQVVSTETEDMNKGMKRMVDLDSNYDDADDLTNEWPLLVCCFGALWWEFVPTVQVLDRQMHPDQYSTSYHTLFP
jgi:hypothetical protein